MDPRTGEVLMPPLNNIRDEITRGRRHSQSRTDSLMESLTNTAIGFGIALLTWTVLAQAYGIPMSFNTNLQITAWFTAVSIARQYVLRRLFDGRSPWQALKGLFS